MRNIELGQTEITVGKDHLKIFDRERTVVDAFRHLSHEIAVKALQEYLKQREPKPNLEKLLKYAKKLRVNIYPYVMALTNMNKSLKQSMKERLKVVAKERDLTFEEVWHNLVLERFLARLCQSKYKTNFILKGGTLLAKTFSSGKEKIPNAIKEVIALINIWLKVNTTLCTASGS